MKKLNITKEAFEKSKYFKNKYGRLEYVSESGKLFKTSKGKILKFNESVEYDYSLVEDWIKRARTAVVDARVGLMDKRSKEILLDDAIECLDLLESAFNDSKNDFQGTKFHIDNFPGAQPTPDEPVVPQLNKDQILMFKESASDDIYSFYEWLETNTQYDSGIHVHYYDNEDGSETVELRFDDRYQWADDVEDGKISKDEDPGVQDWMRLIERKSIKNHWAFDTDEYDGEFTISVRSPNAEDDEEEFMESDKKFDESMNWNGVTDKFIDNDTVQFTRNCPSCGKPHSITVSIRDVEDGMAEYGKGARIQDAFPNFTPEEREFFMSGVCPDCWENM